LGKWAVKEQLTIKNSQLTMVEFAWQVRREAAERPNPAQRKIGSLIFRRAGLASGKKIWRPARAVPEICLALTGRVIYGRLFTQRVALGCYAPPLRGGWRN
jgi:hypothetical protein